LLLLQWLSPIALWIDIGLGWVRRVGDVESVFLERFFIVFAENDLEVFT
jgi:hypothetical protein